MNKNIDYLRLKQFSKNKDARHYWQIKDYFNCIFTNNILQISSEDWDVIINNFIENPYYNKYYASNNLYVVILEYFALSCSIDVNDLNNDLIIGAIQSLAKLDDGFIREAKFKILELSHHYYGSKDKDNAYLKKLAQQINKLNFPKIIKNDKQLFEWMVKKSTRSRWFVDSALRNASFFSEKDKRTLMSKIEDLILKRSPNRENSAILLQALKFDLVKDNILSNLNDNIVNGLNRFIPVFTPKDYSYNKFDLINFYKKVNANNIDKILSDIQKRYINYAVAYNSTYAQKIFKLLEIDGMSPKKAFAQLSALDVDPSFLVKNFPELNKLLAIL